MWQAMDGAVLLVAGGWLWLVAFGKVRLRRDEDSVQQFRRKYGVTLSVVAVLLMAFGLVRLALFVVSGADPAL